MKKLLEIIYFGYTILIFAVIFHWISRYIGMKSWYNVLDTFNFRNLNSVNLFWLFVLYPLLLGAGIYILIFIKKRFSKGKS